MARQQVKSQREPSSIIKQVSSFGSAHQKQADIHYANMNQDTFYKKDWFILVTWVLFYPLGIFLLYKYSIKLRKIRHLLNILPLVMIGVASNNIAMILGLLIPFIFIPIFTIGLLYCLIKTKYFMPYCSGIIISCVGIITFAFFHS